MSIKVFVFLLVPVLTLENCNKNYLKNAKKNFGHRLGYQEDNIFQDELTENVFFLKLQSKNVKSLCRGQIPANVLDVDFSRSNVNFLEVKFLEGTLVRKLNLSGNDLYILRDGTFSFGRLSLLDLKDNLISVIEAKTFDDLPFLEAIFLDGNKIRVWESAWFKNCGMLHLVSMENNQLGELPENATQFLPNSIEKYPYNFLMKILLANNQIRYLHPKAFGNFKKIGFLGLKGNQLFELQSETFKKLDFLWILDLSENNFICFSTNALESLKNVKTLFLNGNKLNEDCAVKVRQFFDGKNDVVHL